MRQIEKFVNFWSHVWTTQWKRKAVWEEFITWKWRTLRKTESFGPSGIFHEKENSEAKAMVLVWTKWKTKKQTYLLYALWKSNKRVLIVEASSYLYLSTFILPPGSSRKEKATPGSFSFYSFSPFYLLALVSFRMPLVTPHFFLLTIQCLAVLSALELHVYVVFLFERWQLYRFVSFYMEILLLLASLSLKRNTWS